MRKEETNKKEYTKPNARLVVFDYREVVLASGFHPHGAIQEEVDTTENKHTEEW